MHSWRLTTLPRYRDGKMLINGRHQFSSAELLLLMPRWDLHPNRDQGMHEPSQVCPRPHSSPQHEDKVLVSLQNAPPTSHPASLIPFASTSFQLCVSGFRHMRSKCTKGCGQLGHRGLGRRKARLPWPPYPLERAAQHPNPLGKGVHLIAHQGRDRQGWG